MYDQPLVSLGIDHNAWFQIEKVMSSTSIVVTGVSSVIGIPIFLGNLVAAAAVAGVVGVVTTAAVVLTTNLAVSWASDKAFVYVSMKLAPDIPPEVMEIERVYPSEEGNGAPSS